MILAMKNRASSAMFHITSIYRFYFPNIGFPYSDCGDVQSLCFFFFFKLSETSSSLITLEFRSIWLVPEESIGKCGIKIFSE